MKRYQQSAKGQSKSRRPKKVHRIAQRKGCPPGATGVRGRRWYARRERVAPVMGSVGPLHSYALLVRRKLSPFISRLDVVSPPAGAF